MCPQYINRYNSKVNRQNPNFDHTNDIFDCMNYLTYNYHHKRTFTKEDVINYGDCCEIRRCSCHH